MIDKTDPRGYFHNPRYKELTAFKRKLEDFYEANGKKVIDAWDDPEYHKATREQNAIRDKWHNEMLVLRPEYPK